VSGEKGMIGQQSLQVKYGLIFIATVIPIVGAIEDRSTKFVEGFESKVYRYAQPIEDEVDQVAHSVGLLRNSLRVAMRRMSKK
jgi:hypothetical protein